MAARPDHEVVVVGAGFGGIGAGIELKKAGIQDFVMIDKGPDVGGTWQANTYPGVAVDIPSVVYSFSYEPPKVWSRFFAPGHEVKAYADQLVDSYGLRQHIRLRTRILESTWDERAHLWRIRLAGGETVTARFLIGAVGALEVPKLPDIDGVDDFAGKTVHTARWDHDYDYAGKRIAVIGTGATALQLIPELAKTARRLAVFQRTPIWVAPKLDFAIRPGVRKVLFGVPGLHRLVRLVTFAAVDFAISTAGLYHKQLPFLINGVHRSVRRWHYKQLPDKELRDKLTPRYTFGCKRPSVSNTYLRTFTRDHVDLITDPIAKITDRGVVTESDTEHEVDVLVLATGFKIMEPGAAPPFPVHGRDGFELGEFWQKHRYQAYQGVSVPRFPNLFLVFGPHSFTSGSFIAVIECTTAHAIRAISRARWRGATSVEIRPGPHQRYFQKCVRRLRNTVWFNSNCEISNTYYVNDRGEAPAIRPSTHLEMWWGNRHFPHRHYNYSTVDG